MILKLKVKKAKKIILWIQTPKQLKEDLNQVFKFFADNISIKKQIRVHRRYKITSENPAILLSLHSTVQDLIPESFFQDLLN